MKKYLVDGIDIMWVGRPQEIKAMYKSIKRANYKMKTNWFPLHDNDPKYNQHRFYGIYFDTEIWYFNVINEHTALSLIVDGIAVES